MLYDEATTTTTTKCVCVCFYLWISKTEPQPPNLSLRQPKKTFLIRRMRSAEAHITHGSPTTTTTNRKRFGLLYKRYFFLFLCEFEQKNWQLIYLSTDTFFFLLLRLCETTLWVGAILETKTNFFDCQLKWLAHEIFFDLPNNNHFGRIFFFLLSLKNVTILSSFVGTKSKKKKKDLKKTARTEKKKSRASHCVFATSFVRFLQNLFEFFFFSITQKAQTTRQNGNPTHFQTSALLFYRGKCTEFLAVRNDFFFLFFFMSFYSFFFFAFFCFWRRRRSKQEKVNEKRVISYFFLTEYERVCKHIWVVRCVRAHVGGCNAPLMMSGVQFRIQSKKKSVFFLFSSNRRWREKGR